MPLKEREHLATTQLPAQNGKPALGSRRQHIAGVVATIALMISLLRQRLAQRFFSVLPGMSSLT